MGAPRAHQNPKAKTTKKQKTKKQQKRAFERTQQSFKE